MSRGGRQSIAHSRVAVVSFLLSASSRRTARHILRETQLLESCSAAKMPENDGGKGSRRGEPSAVRRAILYACAS